MSSRLEIERNQHHEGRGSVVIVGGGIIGLMSAWYLVRDGWKVTVVDRGRIGAACSHGNCGLVCPSHVLPLTEPGAFKQAMASLLTPHSAFRVRPRLDPALWSWLWKFWRRCNQHDMLTAAHGIQALLNSAMQEYHALVEEHQILCEWQEKGLLFVYQQQHKLDAYDAMNRLLTGTFNEPAQKLDAEATIALEPALKETIAGAWYYEHDAHLRPDILIASLRGELEKLGTQFIEDCRFTAISGSAQEARQIITSQGDLTADSFVFATGAWTPMLNEQLGVKIPIEPGKGYSITMPRPSRCPAIPMIFPEQRVAVTPMQSGYRLGSIMEFVGYDDSIPPRRLELLRAAAELYLHEPLAAPELERWYGWRPMTYDSLPIMDRSPRWGNAWIAAGHNMLGLSMAPATGRLVAELIGSETPHLDPTPYRLSRFS